MSVFFDFRIQSLDIIEDTDRAEWPLGGSQAQRRLVCPVICLEHLTEAQARAYMLADNKLTDRSSWDDAALAARLKELSELALDFDCPAIICLFLSIRMGALKPNASMLLAIARICARSCL
jgi:hypothetical protein